MQLTAFEAYHTKTPSLGEFSGNLQLMLAQNDWRFVNDDQRNEYMENYSKDQAMKLYIFLNLS